MPATARVMVYLEPELKAELERVAAREGRTLSGLFRYLGAQHVRRAAQTEAHTDTSKDPPS